MQSQKLEPWHEDHSFGQDKQRPGEKRMVIVIAITAVMMAIEIVAGMAYGSMALLADGLHMASHVAALSVSAFAYVYARRHAHDSRFSFGTGKVNALGGFAGAVLLGAFAGVMAWESVERLIRGEISISFNEAIIVAVVGLIVNGACALVLGHTHEHHGESGEHEHCDHRHDHNLRAAYFHVIADALTSVLAIIALIVAKYSGMVWPDPVVGIVGALIVGHWAFGLVRATSRILLDRQAPAFIQDAIRSSIEAENAHQVVDLHVWSIGPQLYAAEIVVLSDDRQPPIYYKNMLPHDVGLVHVTIEVHSPDDSPSMAGVESPELTRNPL